MTPTLTEWDNTTGSPAGFHSTFMDSSPVLRQDQLFVTGPPPGLVSRAEPTGAAELLSALQPGDQLLYGGSIHPHLRTVRAFPVRFERRDGGFSAVVPELEEFGVGDTRSDALDDLRHGLAELYFSLARDEERLSDTLRQVWSALKTYVIRTRT